jgi:hypothetical protein
MPALGPGAMMVVAVCNDEAECLASFLEQNIARAPHLVEPGPPVEALAA